MTELLLCQSVWRQKKSYFLFSEGLVPKLLRNVAAPAAAAAVAAEDKHHEDGGETWIGGDWCPGLFLPIPTKRGVWRSRRRHKIKGVALQIRYLMVPHKRAARENK